MPPQKYTDARKEGNRKWDTANRDRVSIAMPKGKKDDIKAAAAAVEAIAGLSKKVSTNDEIAQVATISANGDTEIGAIISVTPVSCSKRPRFSGGIVSILLATTR